ASMRPPAGRAATDCATVPWKFLAGKMNVVLRRSARIRKCQMSLSALHVKWTPGKRTCLPTNEGHAMKVQSRTRSLATAALVALLVASFGAAAAPQPRDNPRQEHRDDRREHRQDHRQERRADH